MERAIANISPEDAARFHTFITHNRVKLEKFLPFLQSPFESWRDLMRPEMLKLLPLLAPWRSLDTDLQVHFKDERIRLGFSFQSKYLGMSPFPSPPPSSTSTAASPPAAAAAPSPAPWPASPSRSASRSSSTNPSSASR